MVESRLGLEGEVLSILQNIDEGNDFLLSGGAGSGKTYSLLKVIQQLLLESPLSKIICITYTNSAAREIEGRFSSTSLNVSTIHDFLWDNIKSFQKELRSSLLVLANSEEVRAIKSPDGGFDTNHFDQLAIQYKEYSRIAEGIISHDEILVLAHKMYQLYPKLRDITSSRYQYIFIDEYQDSSPYVIEVLLNFCREDSKNNCVGLFGDSMQGIYPDGVGDVKSYIDGGQLIEIQKSENRRNPENVIALANTLRDDDLVQVPSEDVEAPNMLNGVVKLGKVSFFFSTDRPKLDELKSHLDWDFGDSSNTKELNLTHNLIAPRANFEELMAIYDGDKILAYKKRVRNYIKNNEIDIDFSDNSFGEVIDILLEGKNTVAEKRPILPTQGMKDFIDGHSELFSYAEDCPWEELRRVYVAKENLIDDKKDTREDESKTGSMRDNLIKHLFTIQMNINLYSENRIGEFLRKTEYKVRSIDDKIELRSVIETLKGMSESTIEEVIEYANASGICVKDDKLVTFIKKKRYVYDRVKALKFSQFQNLFRYLEGYTPFSTQHKIKGSQFDNVLVVMDNGNWSMYNFEYVLHPEIFESLSDAKKRSFESILNRTRKLFYVCCTRSKEELAIYYHSPSDGVLAGARALFGNENVVCI